MFLFCFWSDAFLKASHPISQMLSFVIQDQILYSILNLQHELYPISLHVFGFTCFVHDLIPSKDKLSAIKYIFLEHSRIQKGYRSFSSQLQ